MTMINSFYFPNQTIKILDCILKNNVKTDIRAQLQVEKLIDNYFAEIFADFQPEDTYGESHIMNELLYYISLHYSEPITLETLASHVNEKTSHVSYLFYKYKQIRPIDYLINYRIKIATDFLRSGDYTVTEVANMVGYKDVCYFSRIYKKRVGFSPTRIMS